ncbi:MAG: RHS repeat domain-containing protein [Planctomycetota bacterium]|jgi:RHS repeat-associated protein
MSTGSGGVVNNQGGECDCVEVANPGEQMERIYTYDNNRNLKTIEATNTPWYNQNFTYDPLNRLTEASGRYGEISYTYDDVGNRLTRDVNEQIETYSYITGTNKLEKITGANSTTFTYDANGNTTGIGEKVLVYNQNNRLIRVEEDGATLGEYTYNGLGQRVIKEVNGVTTIFHYDPNGKLIAESLPNGTITAEYLYMGNIRMAKVDVSTGKVYYYLNDRLGTPQLMTDDTGSAVWEAAYKTFGEASVNPKSSVENNFRFPGQYYDEETGLQYNYFRFYDPRTGRYLTPDPIGLDVGINLYIYVYNNAINETDRYGLWGEDVHSGIGNPRYGTYTWAMQVGFSDAQARMIAKANEAADFSYSGWLPVFGLQSRHFNQPLFIPKDFKDSREYWASVELQRAAKSFAEGDCEAALGNLGKGLHSIQDKYAHRDWDTGLFGFRRHPEWFDIWNDPRNTKAREITEMETKGYLRAFLQLRGQQ